MKLILMGDINLMDVTNPAEPESGRSRFALQETRHQNVVLGDSGPKSRFGRQFPHTETSPYARNAEEQPIAVRELDPTAHLALKYNQLTSQCGILSLKLADAAKPTASKRRRAARPSRPTLRDSFTRSSDEVFGIHTHYGI
jgi:hypothetical protein